MFGFIAKLTMVRVPVEAQKATVQGLTTPAPSSPQVSSKPISIFVNPKALNYPILVGLVKGAWEAAKVLPPSTLSAWLLSNWFPFWSCIILGLLIAISNLSEEKPTILGWVLGLSIGCLNSLVIFGAVMGISPGK